MASRKVGIIGSGSVGQTLGKGFLRHGYQVTIGTRNPENLMDWVNATEGQGKVGSFAEAAAFGEILVFAVKGAAAEAALQAAGADNLANKLILDTTNPIAAVPPENGVLKYFSSLDRSLMEQLQATYPKARFVKAFSCIGAAAMVNPDFGGEKPTMFYCGNHSDAKKEAERILVQFGFEPADMGGAEAARAIEPLAMLWCIPGFLHNQWSHAFRLLHK